MIMTPLNLFVLNLCCISIQFKLDPRVYDGTLWPLVEKIHFRWQPIFTMWIEDESKYFRDNVYKSTYQTSLIVVMAWLRTSVCVGILHAYSRPIWNNDVVAKKV